LKKKDVKKTLLDINDESINIHVKSYNEFRAIGLVLMGVGTIFGLIAVEKAIGEESYFGLTPLYPEGTSDPYFAAFLITYIGGVVLLVSSPKHFNKAVDRYNEIVITPTSNGVGLVYRF